MMLGGILYMLSQNGTASEGTFFFITLGGVAQFVQYSRKFAGPINEFANILHDFQSAFSAAERVFRVIDETPETPDVSDSAFDEALRRAGLSHLVEDTAEAETTETAPPPRKSPERDPEEVRLDRIRAHETLANALMEAAQNEYEFRLVKNYKQKAAELEAREKAEKNSIAED